MTMPILDFTSAETWFGGYSEIEPELGVPPDKRLALALQTFGNRLFISSTWSCHSITLQSHAAPGCMGLPL